MRCAVNMKWLVIALALVLFLSAFGCQSDDDDDDSGSQSDDDDDTGDDDDNDDNDDDSKTLSNLNARGRQYLITGEFASAYDAFHEALKIQKDDPDALFGISLAQLQHSFNMLDMALGAIRPYVYDDVPEDEYKKQPRAKSAGQKAQWLDDVVETVLANLHAQIQEQLTRLDTLMQVEEFEFQLEGMPLKIKGADFFNLHSEWDKADLYFLSAFYNLFDSLVLLFQSNSFEGIGDLLDAIDQDDIGATLIELLINNPDLLALKEDGGSQSWTQAGQALQNAAGDMVTAAQLARSEGDDQTDDVFLQNDSLNKDGVAHFAIHGDFISGVAQVQMLWDGKTYSLQSSLSRLSDHLDGQTDLRMRLDKDLLPVLSVFLDFLIQGVGVPGVLELLPSKGAAMASWEEKLGTGETLPWLLDLLLTTLDVPLDGVQFDLYSFYSRPFSIRDLLPNFGADPFEGRAAFFASYECARLGFGESHFSAGDDIALYLVDRGNAANQNTGPDNDQVTVTIYSNLPSAGIIDTETVILDEDSVYEALFHGTLPSSAASLGAPEDGTLQVPFGATVQASYLDESGAPAYSLVSEYDASGETDRRFEYSLSCHSGTARDYERFAAPEFADGIFFDDPPAAADPTTGYPVAAIDGLAQSDPFYAFKTPTINGLVWIDMSTIYSGDPTPYGFVNGFAPADSRSINLLLSPLLDLIGGLL